MSKTSREKIHEFVNFTAQSVRHAVREYFLIDFFENDPVARMVEIRRGLDTSGIIKIRALLGSESAKKEWNELQGSKGKGRLQ